MKNTNVKRLVVSAVLIGLATVLSMIKIYQLPYGGSVTLASMLPIVVICVAYGPAWGFAASFVYSVIQFAQDGFALSWGLTGGVWVVCAVFDYFLPFTLLGTSGLFRRKGTVGVVGGVCLAMVLRFACHFISGYTIWRSNAADAGFTSPALYSLVYNGSFMLPELIVTAVIAGLLFKSKQIKKLLSSDLIA